MSPPFFLEHSSPLVIDDEKRSRRRASGMAPPFLFFFSLSAVAPRRSGESPRARRERNALRRVPPLFLDLVLSSFPFFLFSRREPRICEGSRVQPCANFLFPLPPWAQAGRDVKYWYESRSLSFFRDDVTPPPPFLFRTDARKRCSHSPPFSFFWPPSPFPSPFPLPRGTRSRQVSHPIRSPLPIFFLSLGE